MARKHRGLWTILSLRTEKHLTPPKPSSNPLHSELSDADRGPLQARTEMCELAGHEYY
ncbi:hypothetical protein BDW69DRAFT_154618 [Aspergillus filifer]